MTVGGTNLGFQDVSTALRLGLTAAQNTFWISNTALSCQAIQGQSRSWALVVSVGSGGRTCPNPLDPLIKTSVRWSTMTGVCTLKNLLYFKTYFTSGPPYQD